MNDPLTKRILEFIKTPTFNDCGGLQMVPEEVIYARFGEGRKDVITKCLDTLRESGDIYSPRAGYVRSI